MYTLYKIVSLFLCSTVITYNSAKAVEQDSVDIIKPYDSTQVVKKNNLQSWITLAYAAGSIQKETLIGLIGGIDFQLNHHLLSARIITSKSYQEHIQPIERALEIALLYGYGVNNSLWYVNVSVGLAYVSITRRILIGEDPDFHTPFYEAQNYKDIGIPWQGRIFSKFSDSSKVGLGFSFSGDVNKPGSLFFISLALEIFLL